MFVHCRIGSLEEAMETDLNGARVHCRIGSLEGDQEVMAWAQHVHCRIGSLEVVALVYLVILCSSLPHRQLRSFLL